MHKSAKTNTYYTNNYLKNNDDKHANQFETKVELY